MYHSLNYRILAFSLTVFAFVGEVVAQNRTNASSGVVFRVLTFDRVKDLKVIDLMEGETRQKISMHKNNYTGPYKSSQRELRFFRPAVENEGDDAKPVSAGRIKVPSSLGARVLLIAVPGKDKKYHFFPVADDFQKFGAGKMKLINLTKVSIAARLNNKSFKAAPMSVSDLGKLSLKNEPHSYPAEFYFREGDKWSPLSSSSWLHEPDVRQLAFCFKEPKTGRIRIRTIRELPAAKPE